MDIEGINFVNFNKYTKDVHEVSQEKKYIFSNDDSVYFIPVFQRKYCWGKEEIKKILEDAENAAFNKIEHYCGTIVALKKDNSNNKFFLIDG